MKNKVNKRWASGVVILIAIITLGIIIAFTKKDNSESEIIGQKDASTNIWIGEKVE